MAKSLLMQQLSDYADSKLLKITGYDSFSAQIDRDYELTPEGELLRKATNQSLGKFNIDEHGRTLLRPVISDRSFGAHKSRFPARNTTQTERSILNAVLDSNPVHFTDTERAGKLKKFLMDNFVISGNKAHRLSPDGYLSSQSWDVDYLVKQYAPPGLIDDDRTTYLRLKRDAELRAEAQALAPTDKDLNRVKDLLERINEVKFPELPKNYFAEQAVDLEQKALSHLNIIDKKAASLSELNTAGVKVKNWLQSIDTLPPAPEL